MSDLRYKYGISVKNMALCVIFFLPCACILAYEALNNDSGLIINRVIGLSATQAAMFYWTLTAFSIVFVVMGTTALLHALFKKPEDLIITDESIFIPRSGLAKERIILFSDINFTKMQKTNGVLMFTIKTKDKKKTVINNTFIQDKETFKEITDTILNKLQTKTLDKTNKKA